MSQKNNHRLLLAQDLEKSYGIRTIFSIDKLELFENDRIGLVGANGAGKSTLLSILAGELAADSGTIERTCTPAMIRQSGKSESIADGQNLSTMGLTGSACKSGGEKTRLSIASALSKNTPLLFADEPTTNLDIAGIQLLESKLNTFSGTLVLVSHDRSLLDNLCSVIWELEGGSLRVFPGNYSDWLEQKARERDYAEFEYVQYKKEKRRLEQSMCQIREEASTFLKPPRRMGSSEWMLYKNVAATQQSHVHSQAKSIAKRLEHMEEKERPDALPKVSMALGTACPLRSKTAVRIDHLTVCRGTHTILDKASCVLPAGARTVMLGANGSGKTTLIRALLQLWHQTTGAASEPLSEIEDLYSMDGIVGAPSVHFASGLRIGYFSQEHETLSPDKTVLENARVQSTKPEHEVRTILANLYLRDNDVHKSASMLSGGERAKTALAQLLASDANLLILDEPTNHIDLYTTEALENLLCKWKGTLLVVTHDQRLAENVADRLLICQDQRITAFEGSWEDYQESLTRTNRQKQQAQSQAGSKAQLIPESERALQETIIAMRLAELSSRISAPKKGDKPQELQAQWEQLNEEYQRIKKMAKSGRQK